VGDESPPKESPVTPLSQKEVPLAPLSQPESAAAPLSQWLQLMLAEIARKRDEQDSARAEAERRASENPPLS